MLGKLYVYGCSFSIPFFIEEHESWMQLTANWFDKELVNRAEIAIDHRETFHRLQQDAPNFTEEDLVIYQFTAGVRKGYRIGDDDKYYSSAGLASTLEETLEVFDKHGGGRDKYPNPDKLLTLIDYISKWGSDSDFYNYNCPNNLLSSMVTKYLFLHLDDSFKKYIDEHTVKIFGNLSIKDYNRENKIGLMHSGRGVDKEDLHPDEKAHKHIHLSILNQYNGIYKNLLGRPL